VFSPGRLPCHHIQSNLAAFLANPAAFGPACTVGRIDGIFQTVLDMRPMCPPFALFIGHFAAGPLYKEIAVENLTPSNSKLSTLHNHRSASPTTEGHATTNKRCQSVCPAANGQNAVSLAHVSL